VLVKRPVCQTRVMKKLAAKYFLPRKCSNRTLF
jgi:hypothetical protein